VLRGNTRWTGYPTHPTETCDEDSVNVITDVTTLAPSGDSRALPGIHTRLKRHRLLPAEHLVDGGHTSAVLFDTATRRHKVALAGPLKTNNSSQREVGNGFGRDNFIIDFDRREVGDEAGGVAREAGCLPGGRVRHGGYSKFMPRYCHEHDRCQHPTVTVSTPAASHFAFVYDRCMPSPLPTSLAVSDAITHYRQLRELTIDELAYALLMLDHPISADTLAEMERCARPVTVDDLVAIAYVLDTTPATLLSYIPIDLPEPEGPFATGLPSDVDQAELRAWLEGKTTLDHQSRVSWWKERLACLRVRAAHHEEQLQGAYAELREFGDLVVQEADAPPVQHLQWRIQDGEHALNQSEVALALTEHRLDSIQKGV
jgi:transcriptional regulator with XRE-family HTH domain